MERIKTILQIALYIYLKLPYRFTGLCDLLNYMSKWKIITEEDFSMVIKYLLSTRTLEECNIYYSNNKPYVSAWFWDSYIKEPRIEWLARHIGYLS